jgi:hypothetical protein
LIGSSFLNKESVNKDPFIRQSDLAGKTYPMSNLAFFSTLFSMNLNAILAMVFGILACRNLMAVRTGSDEITIKGNYGTNSN